MEPKSKLVTIFRSADHSAESEATNVRDLLSEAEIQAELLGDDAPGVPSGAFEVRVPVNQVPRAEELIAAWQSEISHPGDDSHSLDLVTVFESDAHNAEMEAIAVRGILEASGIPSVLVGASVYPNLPFEVRVPRNQSEDARQIIEESRVYGAEAAEEAARATEGQVTPEQEPPGSA